jgi:hypothetical protein
MDLLYRKKGSRHAPRAVRPRRQSQQGATRSSGGRHAERACYFTFARIGPVQDGETDTGEPKVFGIRRVPDTLYRCRSGRWSSRSLDNAHCGSGSRNRADGGRRAGGATAGRHADRRTTGRTRRGTARLARRSADRVRTRLLAVEQRTRLAAGHRHGQGQHRQSEQLTHDLFSFKPTCDFNKETLHQDR